MRTHVSVLIYARIHAVIDTYVCMYVCTHIRTRAYICPYTFLYGMSTNARPHTCNHARAHIVYTDAHTQDRVSPVVCTSAACLRTYPCCRASGSTRCRGIGRGRQPPCRGHGGAQRGAGTEIAPCGGRRGVPMSKMPWGCPWVDGSMAVDGLEALTALVAAVA